MLNLCLACSALDKSLDSFYQLTPEQILKAIESLGLGCTGYQLGLNWY